MPPKAVEKDEIDSVLNKDEQHVTPQKVDDNTTTDGHTASAPVRVVSFSTDANNKKKNVTEGEQDPEQPAADNATATKNKRPIKLYKSTRLKGYITLALASFINFDAALKSNTPITTNVVPAKPVQRNYAICASIVSACFTVVILLFHFDRITPLEKIWVTTAFAPKSRVELGIILFLVAWWSVATGIQTAIGGIAGDGKGQFSLFYSTWACCIASWWILERWWVASDRSSWKSFITSWPYRAPAWICILFLTTMVMIWYLNLWQNFADLDREIERPVYEMFKHVPEGQWQWLVIIAVFTMLAALGFCLVELFRDIKEDGNNVEKTQLENYIEGATFTSLVLAWIPTVIVATTPGGAASLIGNAYFFTWLLVVFLFEGLVWWIHDYRLELHQTLRLKEKEYRNRQHAVLAQTRERLAASKQLVSSEQSRRTRDAGRDEREFAAAYRQQREQLAQSVHQQQQQQQQLLSEVIVPATPSSRMMMMMVDEQDAAVAERLAIESEFAATAAATTLKGQPMGGGGITPSTEFFETAMEEEEDEVEFHH